MRFLLHAPRSSSTKTVTAAATKAVVATAPPPSRGRETGGTEIEPSATTQHQLWGQQCSPKCGCVVRLQANVQQDTTIAATYHAKTIVTRQQGGQRTAVLTSKGRPMMTECQCKTLHALATSVTEYMTNNGTSLDRLRNSLVEFESFRSSAAFRHAALKAQNLNAKDTHCFDVVEEALIAMLKGYMPQPRRQIREMPTMHPEEHEEEEEDDDEETGRRAGFDGRGDPFRLPSFFQDEDHRTPLAWPLGKASSPTMNTSTNGSSFGFAVPRQMSTLTMFDMQESWLEQQRDNNYRKLPHDWVSFVDEQQEESTTG